jgi:hypothetical protein
MRREHYSCHFGMFLSIGNTFADLLLKLHDQKGENKI